VELLLSGYLQESYSANAYAVNVYVIPGPQAIRLTRISREDLEKNGGPRVECSFRKVARKGKTMDKRTSNKSSKEDLDRRSPTTMSDRKKEVKTSRKRKRQATFDADDESNGFMIADESGLEYGDEIEDFTKQLRQVDAQTSEPEDDGWTFSMSALSRIKPRRDATKASKSSEKWDDEEIITLSSD